MAIDLGLNCRATGGFVTDGAGQVAILCSTDGTTGTDSPADLGGVATGGWLDRSETASNPFGRDRNSGVDPRAAGANLTPNSSSFDDRTFQVDVAGVFDIHLWIGDHDFAQTDCKVEVMDNNGTLFTVGPVTTSGAAHFVDANGVEHTSVANVIANSTPRRVTVVGALKIRIGWTDGAGSGNTALAHLRIVEVEGGGDFVPDPRLRGMQGGMASGTGGLDQ